MTSEILERDTRDVSRLSNTERGQLERGRLEHGQVERGQVERGSVMGEHHGSAAFAWGLIGALAAVLTATVLAILFF
jgi:hypothetical protein